MCQRQRSYDSRRLTCAAPHHVLQCLYQAGRAEDAPEQRKVLKHRALAAVATVTAVVAPPPPVAMEVVSATKPAISRAIISVWDLIIAAAPLPPAAAASLGRGKRYRGCCQARCVVRNAGVGPGRAA